MTDSRVDLSGVVVVVARVSGGEDEISEGLRVAGAMPMTYAVLTVEPPEDTDELDRLIRRIGSFDWLAITSANGVRAIGERLKVLESAGSPRPNRIAALGGITARAVSRLGWEVDLVPERQDSVGLAEALSAARDQTREETVLLVQSDIAGRDLADRLGSAGFALTAVTGYRVVVDNRAAQGAAEQLATGANVCVLTSPSAARAVGAYLNRADTANSATVGMGQRTADECRRLGFVNVNTAEEPTPDGVVRAVAAAAGRTG